jgi:hypothetical protein
MRYRPLIFGGLGIAVLLSVIAVPWNEHYRSEGFSGWLNWLAFWDHPGTHFAPGFSEKQFSRVKPGMTRSQVESLLGKPLDTAPWDLWDTAHEGECWDYSLPVTNVWNYHLRDVIFDPNGKVFVVGREFYMEGQDNS